MAQGVGQSGADDGLGARLGDGDVGGLARGEDPEPRLRVVVELGGLDRGLLGGQLGRVGVDDGVERAQSRCVGAGRRVVERQGRHGDGDRLVGRRRGRRRGGAEEGARGGEEQQQQRREAAAAAASRRGLHLFFLLKTRERLRGGWGRGGGEGEGVEGRGRAPARGLCWIDFDCRGRGSRLREKHWKGATRDIGIFSVFFFVPRFRRQGSIS